MLTVDEQRARKLYRPRGASKELFTCTGNAVLIVGPAGTGKTRSVLEYVNRRLLQFPGSRVLICRKTRASMTESVLVIYERHVVPYNPALYPQTTNVQRRNRQAYAYPNGSALVVGGLDNPDRIMSTEYDLIAVFEATETVEDDLEMLMTRLRNGVMPYQQVICDCNPNKPSHYLNQRANQGKMVRLLSWHKDNPVLYTDSGEMTERGRVYMDLLRTSLTGTRLKRLLEGQWAAVEGQVWEEWNPELHLINKFDVPKHWRRIRVIDFGYTNPSVCQWWAIDGDDTAYLYRELYKTRLLSKDFADKINGYSVGENIEATIADPEDAQARAVLHSKGIITRAADKSPGSVMAGIQAVAARLHPQLNGQSQLVAKMYVMRDSLVERDALLDVAKKPCCFAEEIESYVWAPATKDRAPKEEPLDVDNHACDCARYMSSYKRLVKMPNARVGSMGYT